MRYSLFLFLAIFFNVLTNFFFKLASMQERSKYWLLFASGLFFGLLNSYFITESVKGIRLSIAFPVFSATSILFLTMVSNLYFHEPLNSKKIAGIIIVCIGIVLLVQEN